MRQQKKRLRKTLNNFIKIYFWGGGEIDKSTLLLIHMLDTDAFILVRGILESVRERLILFFYASKNMLSAKTIFEEQRIEGSISEKE